MRWPTTSAPGPAVEHCFGVIKCIFGFRKVRYRGLAKNTNRLMTAAALCNLYMVRRKLA